MPEALLRKPTAEVLLAEAVLRYPDAELPHPEAVLVNPSPLAFAPAAVLAFPTAIGERLLKQTAVEGRPVRCEPSPVKHVAQMDPAQSVFAPMFTLPKPTPIEPEVRAPVVARFERVVIELTLVVAARSVTKRASARALVKYLLTAP